MRADGNIWAEYVAAEKSERGFNWMLAQGVGRDTLICGPEFTAEETIIKYRDGTYQPHESGQRAFLMPLCRHYQWWRDDFDVVDLCAWQPSQPGKVWFRRDLFPILNPAAAEFAEHFDEPLLVHDNILNWLIADRAGCVVFDWSRAPFWLSGASEIRVDSRAVAECLEKAMSYGYRGPQIVVAA